MIVLSADSASELFALACEAVLRDGRPVAPRGMDTLEVLGAHLHLRQPRRRLVSASPVRLLNPAFAAAETVWILSGSDGGWIYDYNTRLREFADDEVLLGAYGPRLRHWNGQVDQLARARHIIDADPGSRRCVIQLYDPGCDRTAHKDVPCTLGYRFYLRDGRLDMHTTMRSQDLWLGFGYDIFAATVLHELMAGWTGAELGGYHLHIDSLHLYDEHAGKAGTLPSVRQSPVMTSLATTWADFDPMLDKVIAGDEPRHDGWQEFAEVMRAYRLWKAGRRQDARRSAGRIQGPLGHALEAWLSHLAAGSRS